MRGTGDRVRARRAADDALPACHPARRAPLRRARPAADGPAARRGGGPAPGGAQARLYAVAASVVLALAGPVIAMMAGGGTVATTVRDAGGSPRRTRSPGCGPRSPPRTRTGAAMCGWRSRTARVRAPAVCRHRPRRLRADRHQLERPRCTTPTQHHAGRGRLAPRRDRPLRAAHGGRRAPGDAPRPVTGRSEFRSLRHASPVPRTSVVRAVFPPICRIRRGICEPGEYAGK